MRASRLGIASANLLVLAEVNVERIIGQINKHNPAVVVIDSIQMIYKPNIPAAPGSRTQLRDCCMELVYLAKTSGIAVISLSATSPGPAPSRGRNYRAHR